MGVLVTRWEGRLAHPSPGLQLSRSPSPWVARPSTPALQPAGSSMYSPAPLYRLQAPSPLSDAWSKTEHLIFPLLHLSNLCRFLSGTLPLASVSLSLTQLPPALSDPPPSQCSCPCLRRTLPGSARVTSAASCLQLQPRPMAFNP